MPKPGFGFLISLKSIKAWYIAAFLFFGTMCFIVNSNIGVYADDDNAWFYSLTYKIYDSEGWDDRENKLIALMQAESSGENEQITRLIDKRDYTYNYILPEILWSVPRPFIQMMLTGQDYYRIYATQMWAGFVFAYMITNLLVLAALRIARTSHDMWRALAWVAIISMMGAFLPSPKPPTFMLWNVWPDLSDVARRLVWFLQDPSYSFSAFSFTGRNNYILWMLGVFAIRWGGRYRLSYALMALGFFFHASMAMLTSLTLIFIDLAMRPHIFRWKPLIAIVVAAITYDLLVETLWNKVGRSALIALAPLALGGILCIRGEALLKAMKPRYAHQLRRIRAWARANKGLSDVGIFILGWVFTAPLAIYLTNEAASTQSTYFWSQLHIRILSVWQPAILLCACLLAFHRQKKETSYRLNLLYVAFLGLITLSCVEYKQSQKELDRTFPVAFMLTTERMDHIALGLEGTDSLSLSQCALPEALIWYLHIRDYALKEDTLKAYLKNREKGQKLNCYEDMTQSNSTSGKP